MGLWNLSVKILTYIFFSLIERYCWVETYVEILWDFHVQFKILVKSSFIWKHHFDFSGTTHRASRRLLLINMFLYTLVFLANPVTWGRLSYCVHFSLSPALNIKFFWSACLSPKEISSIWDMHFISLTFLSLFIFSLIFFIHVLKVSHSWLSFLF